MLHEVSRTTIQLSKYEDITIVWHNNVLTVRCDSGLHLFDFSYNLKCLDKSIDFCESKIQTSRSSPASDLFPKHIKGLMKNMEISQMVLDPSLWPHNKHLMEATIIIMFEWSPINFIHNNESVLATVNSAGNIDLYGQKRYKWSKIENLSQKLKREMESKIPIVIPPISSDGKINFQVVKTAAYALETSSICWCPVVNEDESSYFVTAQKNGNILFWLLKWKDKCVDAILLHCITENVEEIVTMKWIVISDNEFILISSNALGQIFGHQCKIINNVLEVISTQPLWAHKDKMIAQYIQTNTLEDNIVIVCNKHRHLLSLIINKQCQVQFQDIKNVNDQRITSIIKNNNRFYISNVNRELYEVKYVIENESLIVQLDPVEFKSSIPSVFELYGFALSTNDMFLGLALLDRTILCRKMPMKLDIVLYTEENLESEINTLINNPMKMLTNLWDSIESLRCKTLKVKALPKLDYNNLYEKAKTDIYYGKVYLILLSLYNNLEITVQNGSRGLLPETSVDVIKSHILACHAVELMTKLCNTHGDNIIKNKADTFVCQCLHMASMYLKEFCDRNKMKLDDLLPFDTIKILENIQGSYYTCQWCDNTLKGFVCEDDHINPICSLTFTIIESNDYLICRSCGSMARSELLYEKPKCVFCDIYLCNCYLPS